MAKKRKIPVTDLPTNDRDQLAYCLTLLLSTVSPTLDKGETFDLMYELLDEGLDEQTVRTYGRLVRATAFKTSDEIH